MTEAELLDALDAAVEAALSPKRASHARSVASLAAELCRREGLEPALGRVAGLAHDLCRELPASEQAALAALCPVLEARELASEPRFAHGPAAATLLAQRFGVANADVLEAVAFHTLPKSGCGVLTRILYLADKYEPGRKHVDTAERERILALSLDAAFAAAVRGVVAWIRTEGLPLAPQSADLYNAVQESQP